MASTTADHLSIAPKSGLIKHNVRTHEGIIQFETRSISCYCGLIGWCKHASALLKRGEDNLGLVFEKYGSGVVPIPYVPTHSMWVPVHFKPIDDSSYLLEIEDPAVKHHLHSADDLFLGIVTLSEGRAIVRSMIASWFVRFNPGGINCTSSGHGWKEAKAVDAAHRAGDRAFVMANEWNLRWSTRCLPCESKAAQGFGDLVPEGSRPTWNTDNTIGDLPF